MKVKIVFFLLVSILMAEVKASGLLFPLDCQLGTNCWLSSLPRHYFKDKQLDFRCGPLTKDSNLGTEFIIKDMQQMMEGVDVIAPISGKVIEKKDGHEDTLSLGSDTCGNMLAIANEQLIVTFCHLKNTSVRLGKGEEVSAGEVVGQVGSSGYVDHPKLFMKLEVIDGDGKVRDLDPFYGKQFDCGLPPESLWDKGDFMDFNARTGVVFNYGFAFDNITARIIANGEHKKNIPANPKIFIGFVEMLSVNKGDIVNISITDSSGNVIASRKHEFGKFQARYLLYVEKTLRQQKIKGNFELKIKYQHYHGKEEEFTEGIKL